MPPPTDQFQAGTRRHRDRVANFRSLVALVRQLEPDVIVTQHWSPRSLNRARVIARAAGARLYVDVLDVPARHWNGVSWRTQVSDVVRSSPDKSLSTGGSRVLSPSVMARD